MTANAQGTENYALMTNFMNFVQINLLMLK